MSNNQFGEMKHISYLDGLRGLLAILVVANHVVGCFYPWLFYNDRATRLLDKIWVNTPINAITNGSFAVQLFYIISGYLISLRYIHNKSQMFQPFKHLVKMFKIRIPSIILIWIIMRLGWNLNASIGNSNPGVFNVLYSLNNFEPSLKTMLYDIFVRLFLVDYCQYNPPLWFMMPFFYGTIVVHILNGYLSRLNNYWHSMLITIICIACLALVNYYMCGMFCGIVVAYTEFYGNSIIEKIRTNRFLHVLVLLVSFYLATINIEATGIWSILRIGKTDTRTIVLVRQLGCMFLFYEVVKSNFLQRLLSKRVWVELGHDSMFIFVYHWAVMITLGCELYLWLLQVGLPGPIDGIIILVTVTTFVVIIHRLIEWLYNTLKKGVTVLQR